MFRAVNACPVLYTRPLAGYALGMTEQPPGPPLGPPSPGPYEPGFHSEQLHYEPVGARLPEKVANGVFCTGAVVIEGPGEFVLDFIQGLARPPRVAARVIVHHQVMGQFVAALKDNLARYEAAFGPPKPIPRPPTEQRPNIKELYEQLKMADEQLSGVYATTVMIGHSPAEFMIDFITRFFPHAAVSSRVFLSASSVPRVLETMENSFRQHLQRRASGGQPPPGMQPPMPGPLTPPMSPPPEGEQEQGPNFPEPGPDRGF